MSPTTWIQLCHRCPDVGTSRSVQPESVFQTGAIGAVMNQRFLEYPQRRPRLSGTPLPFDKLRDKLLTTRTEEQTGKHNCAEGTAAVAPFC